MLHQDKVSEAFSKRSRKRIRGHRSLLSSHVTVLSELCRSWVALLCTCLQVLVFLSSCSLQRPPRKSSVLITRSEISPGHMGSAESIDFVLSKRCTCHTHHSHFHYIFENLVLWPHLMSRETGKWNLGVGWGYAQRRGAWVLVSTNEEFPPQLWWKNRNHDTTPPNSSPALLLLGT